MLLMTWKALRTSCQLCPLTFSFTWILAFLLSTGGVLAQDGQFRYCCDIQKCQNVTEVCRSTPGCAQSCLTGPNVSFPASCTPSWILPGQEYSCFSQYMNASVSRVDQICGQTYSPGSEPAPMVLMDYGTCKQICPGWHLSPLSTSTGPVTLLIQYIFPVVVFCITIPRRRKWEVPDFLFEFGDKRLLRLPRLLASLVVSGIIVTIDMTVWIFTIFVGAGPILVGGITELVLDFEILRYIDHNVSLSANERVELMVTVLCGNLDLEHNAPDTRIKAALRLAEPAHKFSSADLPAKTTNGVKPAAKPTTTPVPNEAVVPRLEETKTHLISMLNCQGTFGSLVGAPVLFFIGSFVVTLDTLRDHIGDNSTALSLSFGMWWTVITHVTIISSCALASNNPSTVASIVAGADKGHGSQKDRHKDQRRHHADQGPHRFHFGMSRVFKAEFMPVALWDRGIMKKRWLERTLQPSNNRASPGRMSGCIHPGQPELQPIFCLMLVPLSAFLLILYPTTLAFVISYTTPRICISCRALTFLVYTASQLILVVVSTWRTHHSAPCPRLPHAAALIAPALAALGAALFTAFAGTILQLLGVYGNCLCAIPAAAWLRDRDAARFNLATDTAEHRAMSAYWSACGYAAVGFVSVLTYLGWWYQRVLRRRLLRGIGVLGGSE